MTDEEIETYFRSLPPGYRFVPTDTELVLHYLKRRILNQELPLNRIHVEDIYKYHPQILTALHPRVREIEWYFFTPRNRKYPNGSRPDRTANGGYWKATKSEETIRTQNGEEIGSKMQLDFYEGTHTQPQKTDWKMFEYTAKEEKETNIAPPAQNNKLIFGEGSYKRLNDCVLCKIYRKKHCKDNNNANSSDKATQEVPQVTSVTCDLDHTNNQHGDQYQYLNASQFNYTGISTWVNNYGSQSPQYQPLHPIKSEVGSSSSNNFCNQNNSQTLQYQPLHHVTYGVGSSNSNNFFNQNYTHSYNMSSMQMSHDPSSLSMSFSSSYGEGLEPVNNELSHVDISSLMLPAHVTEYAIRGQFTADFNTTRFMEPVNNELSHVDPAGSFMLPSHVRELEYREKAHVLPVENERGDGFEYDDVDQYLNCADDTSCDNSEVHQDQSKRIKYNNCKE